MTQALYRKWRPHLWEQVVGQEHIIHTLRNAIRSGHIGHAYLFAGPRGTGKTTTARLLAKAVNCLAEDPNERPCDHCVYCQAVNEGRFLDLIEIDAASNTSVDDIRDLRDKINFSPSQGKYKVYIIDEVHMLSTAAFNALLKTLEEPPAHAIFILATTEVHKIPATVLSRCQRHDFRRIPVIEIVKQMQKMAHEEGIDIDTDALTMIARQATGAMRDAISLLDQLASTGEKITLASAQTVLGTATNQVVIELVNALAARNPGDGLELIHSALDNGTDARQFARQVVEYLRSLLLIRLGNTVQVDATGEVRAQMTKQAAAFEPAKLLGTIRLFNNAATDARSGWYPGLFLELALAEACEEEPIRVEAPAGITKQAVNSPVEAASSTVVPPTAAEENTPSMAGTNAVALKGAVPDAGLTLDEIRQNWRRIRDKLKQSSKPAEALLNSSKPLAVKNGVLILGFATEVLKSKMDTRENLELTCRTIAQVVGKNAGVSCIVVSNQARTIPTDLDVDSDGMVGTALNLGGQIVDKK
jgi:DNA polymerase III subunit gamma/tau